MRKIQLRNRAKVSLIAFATALAASAAQAQVAPPIAAPDAHSDPTVQNAPEGSEGLQDIVVTAQRRSESLQHAAVAVSAVAGDALVNAGVSDVTNLSKLIPSLVVQPSIGSSTNFYLRGVGSYAANTYAENPIAFNFNGVYVARPAAPLGTFYDLDRVEVLKGPQGTLYGRNATGGAINVLPARPVIGENGARLIAEYGNYDAKKFQGYVNIGLTDIAALRIAAQIVDRNGYLSDGYDDEAGQAIRASLMLKPTDRLRLALVADYFRQRGNGTGSVLVPGAIVPNAPAASSRIGGADPRGVAALTAAFPAQLSSGLVAAPKTDGFLRSDFWGVALQADVDLGIGTLTVLPAYRRSEPNYLNYNGGFSGRVQGTADQATLEVRLASPDNRRLGYLLGAYFFDEQQHEKSRYLQGLASDTNLNINLHNNSKAVFGQLNFRLFRGFRLVAGGRYTRETKDETATLQQLVFNVGPLVPITGDLSFNSFTYKAGTEYEIDSAHLLYANVSTGFKSGGFFVAAANNTFKPEHLTAFTIGSKNRFFNNRLQINLEAFYWKYRDQQINHNGAVLTSTNPPVYGAAQITENVGQSRLYGIEAELRLKVGAGGLLGADILYNNTEYTDFVYNAVSRGGGPLRSGCRTALNPAIPFPAPAVTYVVDCSGRPLVNAPQWTINVSYEHRLALGNDVVMTPGLRTHIESSRYLSLEYLAEERQRAYRSSDAFITLATVNDRYALTGFINNIENRTIYAGTSLRPVIDVVYNVLRPPRTYGIRLSAKF